MHGGGSALADRVAAVIPPDTNYVVFDLDKTVHLGITIGEMLGWEIVVDPRCSADLEDEPGPFFTVRRPLGSTAGLLRAVRDWGVAGAFYAGTIRLGDRWRRWDSYLTARLGSDYVDDVQATLRTALMANTSSYTTAQLEKYSERAWRRYLARLVVDRAVIDRIRAHCPDLEAIILSSASTTPTVAHAAAKLGVDAFVASGVDSYDADGARVYTAPVDLPRWLRQPRPRFYSRPGAVFHNSSSGKVRLLHMLHPEIFEPDAVTVGVSDNNFGEDRSWPDHFAQVVALNSTYPFSPFVERGSPCRSIQAVDASPVELGAVNPKKFPWHGTLAAARFEAAELAGRIGAEWMERLAELEGGLRDARRRLAEKPQTGIRREIADLGARVVAGVERYNLAPDDERGGAARELRSLSRSMRRARARMDALARECAQVHHDLEKHLRNAGRQITSRSDGARVSSQAA